MTPLAENNPGYAPQIMKTHEKHRAGREKVDSRE